MPSLSDTIKTIDAAVTEIQKQMPALDMASDALIKLTNTMARLLERRKLLSTYNSEMAGRIDEINAEIDRKIEELEGERSERIANIRHEYENKAAELPAIEDVELVVEKEVKSEKPAEIVTGTVESVKKYDKRYFNKFKNISGRKNFFHAAACSNTMTCHSTHSARNIDVITEKLFSESKVQRNADPLSLANVDQIIHSSLLKNHVFEKCYNIFIILDTSLNFVLTNMPLSPYYMWRSYQLIYDSESKQFIPLARFSKNMESICYNCWRYVGGRHKCPQRSCPMCLRHGARFPCVKPTPESEPFICPKCSAFCQTADCFAVHLQICPRPATDIPPSVCQMIESFEFNPIDMLDNAVSKVKKPRLVFKGDE